MHRDMAITKTAQFGSQTFKYSLTRQSRSDLKITVRPDMSIDVCAPHDRSDAAVEAKVIAKAAWIFRQQHRFEEFQPLPTRKRFISGETIRYLGRQYRLRVQKGEKSNVAIRRPFLVVEHNGRELRASTERLVLDWYRSRAICMFPRFLEQALAKHAALRTSVEAVRVRRMQRRWGSCTPNGTITLNPDLIRASPACIEYVIVHELCHLKEMSHSSRFHRLLTEVMPDWRARQRRLNLTD